MIVDDNKENKDTNHDIQNSNIKVPLEERDLTKNMIGSPTQRSHIEYVDTSFAGLRSPTTTGKKNRMSNLQYRLQGSLNIPNI